MRADIGQYIQRERKKHGLTQEELAASINSSRVTIAKYEAGKYKPSAEAMEKLAIVFGVSVPEIMGNSVTATSVSKYEETLIRRPSMRILFDAAKDAPDEVLQKTADLIEAMKNGKNNE